MNHSHWLFSLAFGVGLGLVFFSGLWLTTRWLLNRPRAVVWWSLSTLGRFTLVLIALYWLARVGTAVDLLVAVAGFTLVRVVWVRLLSTIENREVSP